MSRKTNPYHRPRPNNDANPYDRPGSPKAKEEDKK